LIIICYSFSFVFGRIQAESKEKVIESSAPAITDTIVKHIHFVNEKKDVGLQLSRSDLPSSSSNNKSAQTRWTTTKSRSSNYHQLKSRYLRTIDDPTIELYRPPPLYFNSDCDFLQMMTPLTTKLIEEAKENRLSYLASIPIASFDDEPNVEDDDQNEKQRKSTSNARVQLPSTVISRTKQEKLAKDFLHNFPLLRSLVEEALALQQHQYDMPITTKPVIYDHRPQSAVPQKQKNLKQSSIRAKSVIMTRNINSTRRLYPPPPKTNQMMVTKTDVRNLVDRLSTPKLNKRVAREIASTHQDISSQQPIIPSPRLPSKPISISVCYPIDIFILNNLYFIFTIVYKCCTKTTTFLWYNTCSSING
jgi:hypothetical protein